MHGSFVSLVVGCADDPMFDDALAALRARCRIVLRRSTGEIASEGSDRFDLIVVLQRRPGEHDQRAIDAQRIRHPTARLIQVLGGWCEGETRTGRPMPAAIRLAWHEAASWIAREFAMLAAGGCPTWGLPLTAAADERLLRSVPQLADRGHEGLIVIHSLHFDSSAVLADICATAGYSSTWIRPGQPVAACGAAGAIWDGATMDADEAASLEKFAGRFPGAPIVAILDFPRLDRFGTAIPVAQVVGRPFLIDDLIDRLERAVNLARLKNLPSRVA